MGIKLSARGLKRLEITMRDVMDGLEDAASYLNYDSTPNIVEVLSIEMPSQRKQIKQPSIIPLEQKEEKGSSSNIVDYLIQRELRKTA